MEGWLAEYVFSYWSLIVNTPCFIVFGLVTYNKYAKRWPASKGNDSVDGCITWSEYREPAIFKKQPSESLISYSYNVNGEHYNGVIPTETVSKIEVEKKYYKGAPITVFYSPKMPGYSAVDQPPSQSRILKETVGTWLVPPVIIVNMLSGYIWWLVTQQS